MYDNVVLTEEQKRLSEHVRGKDIGFDRIRRITGYLVGTLDRFNTGKRAEEHDRVKHSTESEIKTEVLESMLA